jgi:hypothetical protein
MVCMPERGFLRKHVERVGWQIGTFFSWLGYLRRRSAFYADAKARGQKTHRIEEPVGHRTRHVYVVTEDGHAFTTSQMDQRWRNVARLYPERVTSLLDIGCCRGWFVVQAAMRPECDRALGIDVVQGFIDAANEGKRLLKLDKTQFEYAFLDDLVKDPVKYRTPYQVIVLLNTYHYMYWGSAYSDKHWPDHDYLLRTLADMCTDRMLFMSPLEVAECPSDIAKRAKEHPEWAPAFTTEQFLATAAKYFDVKPEGELGLRPLYVMRKKGGTM